MKIMSTEDLRQLEVINLCGGERLGYPCELEIDVSNANVISIIVGNRSAFPIFGKKITYAIPWCRIECFGSDAILVRITQVELSECAREGKKAKKR